MLRPRISWLILWSERSSAAAGGDAELGQVVPGGGAVRGAAVDRSSRLPWKHPQGSCLQAQPERCGFATVHNRVGSIRGSALMKVSLFQVTRAEGLLLQAQRKLKEGNQAEASSLLEEVFTLLPHVEPTPPSPTAKFLSQKLDLCQVTLTNIFKMGRLASPGVTWSMRRPTVNQRCSECERDHHEQPRALLRGEVQSSSVQHRGHSLWQRCVPEHRRPAGWQVPLRNKNTNDHHKLFVFYKPTKTSLCVFRPVQIQQIMRVSRAVELQMFKRELGNIKPLLHSSSPSNFVGILSRWVLRLRTFGLQLIHPEKLKIY